MPQRLPRFLAHQQRAEDIEKLATILLETGEPLPETVRGKPLTASADGHHWQRMRGTPIIAKGVGGTAPGTDPLRALIAKERRAGR